jgi:hypothetical protein
MSGTGFCATGRSKSMAASCPLNPASCGLDAVGLVRRLARNRLPGDEFAFISYEPSKGVAERLKIDPARAFFCKTVDQLLKIERDADKLVRQLVGRNFSDGAKEPTWIAAEQVSDDAFNFDLLAEASNHVVGFCSCCKHPDLSVSHFPMLDLRVDAPPNGSKASSRTLGLLARALIAIGAPDGVILNSGNSYHYYGFNPVTEAKWRDFMLKSLLLEPMVDVRYVGHRLLSEKATLRLTKSSDKRTVPHVVACISRSHWIVCNCAKNSEK